MLSILRTVFANFLCSVHLCSAHECCWSYLFLFALQAASYLGKAEELLRWSADLRSLQIPLHLFSQSSGTAASSASTSASSKESNLQRYASINPTALGH